MTDIAKRLDDIKKIHEYASERIKQSKTITFDSELEELAYHVVTKAILDFLTKEVDDMSEELGVDQRLGIEEKLAEVIRIYDGNHRRVRTYE